MSAALITKPLHTSVTIPTQLSSSWVQLLLSTPPVVYADSDYLLDEKLGLPEHVRDAYIS